jgi:hypothetical protein
MADMEGMGDTEGMEDMEDMVAGMAAGTLTVTAGTSTAVTGGAATASARAGSGPRWDGFGSARKRKGLAEPAPLYLGRSRLIALRAEVLDRHDALRRRGGEQLRLHLDQLFEEIITGRVGAGRGRGTGRGGR